MRRSLLVLPALLVGLVTATVTPAAADTHDPVTIFTDTAGTAYEEAVSLLAGDGIVQGCGDDLFCSADVLTRGQFGTILVGALELDATAADQDALVADPDAPVLADEDDTSEPVDVASVVTRYADVDTSVHGASLALLADEGLLSGCGDGELCPNDPLTRGQLATLLVSAFDLPAAPGDETFFIDGGTTHGASAEALGYNGVGSGCGPVTFCTDDTVLRSHAAVFIARAMELVDRVTFEPFDERLAEHEELERQRAEQERVAAEERAERERIEAQERAAQERVDAIAARGQAAVDVALAQLGKPYQWAGSGPSRFDCSGLVYYSWRQAAGITLPRSSRYMHAALEPISRDELIPGDLVFYHSPVSHVAIYLGGNSVVDAPGSGRYVQIRQDGLTRRGVVGYARPGFNR